MLAAAALFMRNHPKLTKIGLFILLGMFLVAAFLLWLKMEKNEAVEDYIERVEAQAAPAREQAADERVQDALINSKNEGDLHHVIDKAPVTDQPKLSAPAHALACERLRKLGRIPADCRSKGSDGSQANPN